MLQGVSSRLRRSISAGALNVFLATLVLLAGSAIATASPATPELEGDRELVSSNGAQLLSWSGPSEADATLEYELQESTSAEFDAPETRYRGTLPSWYISGRLDGRSYFRVRARELSDDGEEVAGAWSDWSEAQVLRVEHHDTRLAVALFIVGALVFTATAATAFLGARGSSREAAAREEAA